MPSEFVDRLRFLAAGQDDLHSREIAAAADRIEELEEALRHLKVVKWEAQHYRKRIHQLAAGLWKILETPPFGEPQKIARAVLGVKDAS